MKWFLGVIAATAFGCVGVTLFAIGLEALLKLFV